MELLDLPPELLVAIVEQAIPLHRCPSNILCACRALHELGLRALHTHLVFHSPTQLGVFCVATAPLACLPRTIVLRGSGASSTFDRMEAALARCIASQRRALELDRLELCLHSHARDPRLLAIRLAFGLVNPRSFRWTGPDPAHHFSTAIVPEAAHHVLNVVPHWTRLQHLTLTNLSLGALAATSVVFADYTPPRVYDPLFPSGPPALETLHLGQATFVPPGTVAATLALAGMPRLRALVLEDVYAGSIWGARVRRSDIEREAGEDDALVARVRALVVCRAATERIVGGDRAEGATVLV